MPDHPGAPGGPRLRRRGGGCIVSSRAWKEPPGPSAPPPAAGPGLGRDARRRGRPARPGGSVVRALHGPGRLPAPGDRAAGRGLAGGRPPARAGHLPRVRGHVPGHHHPLRRPAGRLRRGAHRPDLDRRLRPPGADRPAPRTGGGRGARRRPGARRLGLPLAGPALVAPLPGQHADPVRQPGPAGAGGGPGAAAHPGGGDPRGRGGARAGAAQVPAVRLLEPAGGAGLRVHLARRRLRRPAGRRGGAAARGRPRGRAGAGADGRPAGAGADEPLLAAERRAVRLGGLPQRRRGLPHQLDLPAGQAGRRALLPPPAGRPAHPRLRRGAPGRAGRGHGQRLPGAVGAARQRPQAGGLGLHPLPGLRRVPAGAPQRAARLAGGVARAGHPGAGPLPARSSCASSRGCATGPTTRTTTGSAPSSSSSSARPCAGWCPPGRRCGAPSWASRRWTDEAAVLPAPGQGRPAGHPGLPRPGALPGGGLHRRRGLPHLPRQPGLPGRPDAGHRGGRGRLPRRLHPRPEGQGQPGGRATRRSSTTPTTGWPTCCRRSSPCTGCR